MKTDLATSIAFAIFGILVSFFVCNIFLTSPKDVTFKTVEGNNLNTNLAMPTSEIFNTDSLNPTVEVYVGDCTVDFYGNCIDEDSANQYIINTETLEGE